ncbi:MAG: hypothetical protein LBT09_06325 [Planctomycetaceae bacterium]|nr:hypothetical protein [Planctomycetaceae bacterium]
MPTMLYPMKLTAAHLFWILLNQYVNQIAWHNLIRLAKFKRRAVYTGRT